MNLTKRVAMVTSLFVSLLAFMCLTIQADALQGFQFPTSETLKTKKTNGEIVAALQIPEDILKQMPTATLVKTCLNYPLVPDFVLYNTSQKGIDALIAQFNGLQELMKRKDAGTELLKIYCTTYPQDFDASLPSARIGGFTMKISFLELLLGQEVILEKLTDEQRLELIDLSLRKLETKSNYPDIYGQISIDATAMAGFRMMGEDDYGMLNRESGPLEKLKEIYEQIVISQPRSTQIVTPCGTVVPGTVSSGTSAMTFHERSFVQSYIPVSYPTATIVGSSDSAYNCHGYAWHMSRESIYGPWSEKVSIQTNQPKNYYVTDGSYKTGGTTVAVSYSIDHSAIPEGTVPSGGMSAVNGSQYYISKWGSGYLMRHLPTDVPSGYGSPQGYYSIAPPHTVSINGPTLMEQGEQYTFTSLVNGGCTASPTYQWAYRIGSGSYVNLGTSSTQSFTMGTANVTLRLRVQKGTKVVYDYHTITYDSELSVSISGLSYLGQGQTWQYSAVITGGTGTVSSVSWWAKFAVGFSDSHAIDQNITMGTRNIFLRVTVVKGGQTVSATKTIYYTDYPIDRP